MKHRHKWTLDFEDGGTLGKGLLWSCKCGSCLEWKHKINYKKAHDVLLKLVFKLLK